MASFLPIKIKRKDLDGFNDDFSDFSLSSPARKIRRLDADLPPIIEEDEPEMSVQFQQQTRPVIEELLPVVDENEERAIVLFKPMDTPFFNSSSKFIVDSNLISAIKDQALWGTNSNSSRPAEDEEPKTNECLSVIPWVPSHPFPPQLPLEATEVVASEFEPMDAEEVGSAPMETGDDAVSSGVQPNYIGMNSSGQSMQHQWQQQQHCMIPQPPQNTITPIAWYR